MSLLIIYGQFTAIYVKIKRSHASPLEGEIERGLMCIFMV